MFSCLSLWMPGGWSTFKNTDKRFCFLLLWCNLISSHRHPVPFLNRDAFKVDKIWLQRNKAKRKKKKKTFFFLLSRSLVLKSGAWHALNRGAKGLSLHLPTHCPGCLVDGKCGTLVAQQLRGGAAGVCLIKRACSVILLQIFAGQTLVFKNCFKSTFYGCWDGHRIWPPWFGPDFDSLCFLHHCLTNADV